MSEDDQEMFNERAAIMEFDGGCQQRYAEQKALQWTYDVWMKRNESR